MEQSKKSPLNYLENGAVVLDGTVLFQGDSITDAGRSRENDGDLGVGYPALIAAWFSALNPQKKVRFLNRGISGNRASDLRGRWKEDCLDLKPTWLSILIGINDTWRHFDSNDPTSAEIYEENFHAILASARASLPDIRLVICEPFLLPIPADRTTWRVDLDPKIAAARRLACEFNAIFIPLDGIFAAASAAKGSPAFWAEDGVHPTPAGHALIAQSWLKAVCAI